MKNLSRIISLVLIVAIFISALSSCSLFGTPDNPPVNDQQGDNNKPDSGDKDDNNDEDNTVYFTGKQSVLLIGQSNMAGRGFAEDVEPISDDKITMLNSDNQWVKMQEPIHFDKSAAGVGLAASFAKAFVDTFDTEIGLIPAAFGGTTIADWKVGGTYYTDAIERAKEAQKTSEICAILWHQGESNRNNHSSYAEKLQTILDAMIAELGLDADKIIIITGELREISTGVDKRESFHAELNKLSDVYKNYGVADAEGLTLNQDIIHFDAPSLRVFGYRYFSIFKTLVTGKGYDFVDDRNHYYVGADKDPNPNNSGFTDLPSDNPGGGDIGGNTPTEGRIEVEGTVVADTYVAAFNASSKDKSYEDLDTIATNKSNGRPIIVFNLSNILSDSGFEQNKATGKIEFTFAFVEGGENISADTTASVYCFTPGAGVSDADLSTLTWNSCSSSGTNKELYRGTANYLYKDALLGEVEVRKNDTHITYIFDYTALEQYVCTESGDYYGYLVMGFDFSNASAVKFASKENTSFDIPKVDFVYENVTSPEA